MKVGDKVYFCKGYSITKCKLVRIIPHEKEDIAVVEDNLIGELYTLPISRIREYNRPIKGKRYLQTKERYKVI